MVAFSKSTWRYIPYGTYTSFENMAIDEFLLNQVCDHEDLNVLRFYQWEKTTASLGKHQSLHAEIDLQAAQNYNFDVVRRITGGGAVLHDAQGELTYATICRLADIPVINSPRRVYDASIPPRYHAILEALAQGLETMGFPIDVGAIHCPALLTHGKKISGNAQLIRKNVLLQHGTILLTVKPEIMYQILKAPVGVPKKHMVQSVKAKVTGLFNEVPQPHSRINDTTPLDQFTLPTSPSERSPFPTVVNISTIVKVLCKSFETLFHMQLVSQALSSDEWNNIQSLIQTKYKTNNWLTLYS